MADENFDESEDLSPEELDAEIGPEAEVRAANAARAARVAEAVARFNNPQLKSEEEYRQIINAPDVYGNPAALESAAPVEAVQRVPQATDTLLAGGSTVAPPAEMQGPATTIPATEEQVAAQAALPVEEPVAAEEEIRDQVKQSITPSSLEIEQRKEEKLAPIRSVIADRAAMEKANAELSLFAQREQERQEQIKKQIADLDQRDAAQVRAQSFGEVMRGGNFGQKLLAVLAVGMGAASQAFTGAKENPAIAVINAEVERQAEKDKLTLSQKLQLKNQLLEASMNITKAAQSRFDNSITQQKLQLEYDKLNQEMVSTAQKLQQTYADQTATSMLLDSQLESPIPVQGSPKEVEEITRRNEEKKAALKRIAVTNPKLADAKTEAIVWKPNGEMAFAYSTGQPLIDFKRARADSDSAKEIIKNIIDTVKAGSQSNLFDRAYVQSQLKLLTGKLRETILGPGAMTQQEYDRLYDAVGDPMKIFALQEAELVKLRGVRDNLDADIDIKARNVVGGKWGDLSKRALMVKKFRAAGYSPRQASDAADIQMAKLR